MRRTGGPIGSEAAPLPRRVAKPVPHPTRPVAFEGDPELLTRVVERLRALDANRLAGIRRLN